MLQQFIFETKDVLQPTDWLKCTRFISKNPGGKQQLPEALPSLNARGEKHKKRLLFWLLEYQGIVSLPTWFQRGTWRRRSRCCSLISLLMADESQKIIQFDLSVWKCINPNSGSLLLVNSVIHLHAKSHIFALNTKSLDGYRGEDIRGC